MTARDLKLPGLAPELKGAKKGQGEVAGRRRRASGSPPTTSRRSRSPAAARRTGGSPRCAGCAGCTTAPRRFDGVAIVEIAGAGEGVTVERVTRDDPRVGEGGVPADRVAAAGVVGGAGRHDRDARRPPRAARRSPSPARARAPRRPRTCSCAPGRSRRRRSCSPSRVGRAGRQPRGRAGRRVAAHAGRHRRVGRRRRARRRPAPRRWAATPR